MKVRTVLIASLALLLLATPSTLFAEDVESSPDFSPTGTIGGLTGTNFETSEQGRVRTINRETCFKALSGDNDALVTFEFPRFAAAITDIDSKFFATQEELTLDCNIDARQQCTNVEDMIQVTQQPRELTTAATSYKVEIDFDDLLQSVDADKHNAVSILTPEDCYPPELRGGTNTGGNNGGADAGAVDAGTSDAGTSDAGATDTGTSDAGTSDAGSSDAGATDTSSSDTGGSSNSGAQIGFHNQYFIRVFVEGRVGNETQTQLSDVVFEIDSESAAAPEQVIDVSAFDEQLTVSWRQNRLQDVENHRALVSEKDFRGMSLRQILNDDEIENYSLGTGSKEPGDGVFRESVDVGGLSLSEGDTVWVAVVSEDDVKNLSVPVFYDEAATVVPVIDFWENYKESGGSQGGCSTTESEPGTLAIALLALSSFVVVRRRRRRN